MVAEEATGSAGRALYRPTPAVIPSVRLAHAIEGDLGSALGAGASRVQGLRRPCGRSLAGSGRAVARDPSGAERRRIRAPTRRPHRAVRLQRSLLRALAPA